MKNETIRVFPTLEIKLWETENKPVSGGVGGGVEKSKSGWLTIKGDETTRSKETTKRRSYKLAQTHSSGKRRQTKTSFWIFFLLVSHLFISSLLFASGLLSSQLFFSSSFSSSFVFLSFLIYALLLSCLVLSCLILYSILFSSCLFK
jgi:hypothetical protein